MVQALKFLVIGMGLLIVLAMGLLVYGLVQRGSNPDFSFFPKAEPAKTAERNANEPSLAQKRAPLEPFGEIDVPIPEGCQLQQTDVSRGVLLLRLGPAIPDCQRVIAVDLAGGRVLGTVILGHP